MFGIGEILCGMFVLAFVGVKFPDIMERIARM